MLSRTSLKPLGVLGQCGVQRLPMLAPRTMSLLHTTAVARANNKQAVSGVVEEPPRPNFDPTIPGRMLRPWDKFRAYMTFYKEGMKELWANRRVYGDVKRRMRQGEPITRAEFQAWALYPGDRLRLVPFGVLAILAPELIFLIVLVAPGFCPSTCTTYKAAAKTAARRDALRQKLHLRALERMQDAGLSASDFATEAALAKAVQHGNKVFSLDRLTRTDLLLLYRFLGIGQFGWAQPTSWLRAGVRGRMDYVFTDDAMLLEEQLVGRLGLVELFRACQERGIPAADLPEYQLRQALYNWARLSQRQTGVAEMMPAVWSRLVLLNRSVKFGSGLSA